MTIKRLYQIIEDEVGFYDVQAWSIRDLTIIEEYNGNIIFNVTINNTVLKVQVLYHNNNYDVFYINGDIETVE